MGFFGFAMSIIIIIITIIDTFRFRFRKFSLSRKSLLGFGNFSENLEKNFSLSR